MSRRPLIVAIGLIVVAVYLLGSAAPVAAAPDRVKVGPDLYLQSAGAAPEAERRRADPSRPDDGGRIVGGSPTTIADYPWQAAIAYDESIVAGDGYQRQFCGGTLVAPQVMITAAHCVYDNTTPGSFGPASHYETFTGRTFLSSTEGQVIEWSDYYYFADAFGTPRFNPVTMDYDAIFVVLASPSSSVSVKVAGADEAATWEAGRTARISGWGDQASNANAYPDQLRAAQVQVIGDDFCANPASYGPSFHPELMLCAGVPGGGVDTCQGDSGGPIVVPVSEGGRGTFRLVGDTSWGIGCAEAQYPGIYARIAGGTTMGNGLQSAIQAVTGQNVYGSGAKPVEVPETRITKAPKNNTKTKRGQNKAKAAFRFTSNEPTATFTCRLDGKPAKPCTSPHRLKVKKGRHRMRIVGTNFLGQAGAAATDTFRVKRRRP